MKKTPTPNNPCQIYAEVEHEKVVLWSEPESNYRGVIAIHSTALGPAVGGTRIWNYDSDEAATLDALRLSRAMSYKTALADVPFGGGKAVIIGDGFTPDRKSLFRAHGRFVNSLGGRFITGQDVGTSAEDMEYIRMETPHVVGLASRIGDPSPTTAYGVFRALQAAAKHRWGSTDLTKRAIAIQGCGNTGYELARRLHLTGAKLLVSDTNVERIRRVVDDFGATAVAPDQILRVKADLLAPCALGGVINDETIAQLSVEIVVGSANNQLLEDRHGDKLHELGILYVPDYVANAGGLVHGCRELLDWSETETKQRVDQIYETVSGILKAAGSATAPFRVANQLAERKLGLNQSLNHRASS